MLSRTLRGNRSRGGGRRRLRERECSFSLDKYSLADKVACTLAITRISSIKINTGIFKNRFNSWYCATKYNNDYQSYSYISIQVSIKATVAVLKVEK